jgi:hypothetical protein
MPGLLGIGGEPLVDGVRQREFVDLRNYVRAVLAGNRFAHLYLDRYKRRDICDASDIDTDEGREALACLELRAVVKNGRAEPGAMQELETMPYDELKAKVREHLRARLKAIGERIALLLLSSSLTHSK